MLYSERVDRFHDRPHGLEIDAWLSEWVYAGGPSTWIKQKVLDYGCGTGKFLMSCRGMHPTYLLAGLEPNEELRRIAKERNPNASLFASAEAALTSGEKYNTVVCSQVLGHCEEPEHELLYMRSLLTSTGALLIVIPNLWYLRAMWWTNLRNGYKGDSTIRHMWTKNQLKKLLERCGFVPTFVEGLGAQKYGAYESIAVVARRV